jgi:ligand-binding sensor domain-containing protein
MKIHGEYHKINSIYNIGYKRFILIFLCIFFGCQIISANELIFRTYEPDYHIEGKKITSVTEDPRGFLLLGTRGGIYLFDGLQYTSIPFPDSLKNYEVTNFLCVGKSLWAGLSNGYVLYYEQSGSEPGLLISCNAAVTDMQIDKYQNLWVATYGAGLFVYDKSGKSSNYTQKDGLSDGFVYALEVDSSGWVWAGTDAGLVRCMMKEEKFEIQACTHKDLFPDLIVHALAFDLKNDLWIGFNEGGVVCYDISNQKILCNISAEAIRNGVVSSLLTIDEDVWIATRDGSLFCYNQVSKLLTEFSGTNINPLPSRMLKLCLSHLGGFWVVGDDKVTWSFGKEIEFFYEENRHSVGETHALLADSKDNLWYCTDKGLFCKSLKGNSKLPSDLVFSANEFNKVFFTCLFEDSSGLIWIGTFDRGIIVLNPESGKYQTFDEKNGLSNNNVLSIAGQNNQIWLSTFAGVSRATKHANGSIGFERLNQKTGLGNNYIYQIFIGSDNRVWFATDGSGLSYYENGKFEQLNDSRIFHKAVYSITQDHRGALWFAIADEGVFRLQGDSLRQFGLADGLGSLSVTSVAAADSFIVVVNNHRIDLIDTHSSMIIQTGENIELHNIKAGLNAITSDRNGRFWIGTQFGYISLKNPLNIANLKPILNLKRVLVNLQPIRFDQPIELAYDQNYLSFDFTAIWYPRPGDMRFKVKLDGQDLDWYYTRDLLVSYSNLAPGSYTFHLLVAGNSDTVSGKQIILSFTIRSPFWQRWWFIAVCLGIILLLLRWYLNVRLKKIKKEQQLLHEKIEYEYSNLRNQVNPHFLFNSFSTLIALIESDSKNAVSYVEKLSDYFRSILQYRDTELISIFEEQLLLENYIFLQQKRYANGLHLSINIPVEVQNNQIPPMTLQMLAENALKHNIASRSKQLVIEVFLEGDYLVVSNNLQPKNNPEVSTALGLKNISERYRLFADKQIIVEKSQDKFVVKLPVIHRQSKK